MFRLARRSRSCPRPSLNDKRWPSFFFAQLDRTAGCIGFARGPPGLITYCRTRRPLPIAQHVHLAHGVHQVDVQGNVHLLVDRCWRRQDGCLGVGKIRKTVPLFARLSLCLEGLKVGWRDIAHNECVGATATVTF